MALALELFLACLYHRSNQTNKEKQNQSLFQYPLLFYWLCSNTWREICFTTSPLVLEHLTRQWRKEEEEKSSVGLKWFSSLPGKPRRPVRSKQRWLERVISRCMHCPLVGELVLLLGFSPGSPRWQRAGKCRCYCQRKWDWNSGEKGERYSKFKHLSHVLLTSMSVPHLSLHPLCAAS